MKNEYIGYIIEENQVKAVLLFCFLLLRFEASAASVNIRAVGHSQSAKLIPWRTLESSVAGTHEVPSSFCKACWLL